MRCRKLLQFVEQGRGRTRTDPVLEYAKLSGCFYEFRVRMFDTALPYGPASLNTLSNTFLKLGKSEALTPEDKKDMLGTFLARPGDAYLYAMLDAINTLLVHEEMQVNDRKIYQAFNFPDDEVPPLRPTLGSRVATFLSAATARAAAAGSKHLASRRGLQALMGKGGGAPFEKHADASRYGAQTGKTHGGLLYSRSPTRFWHAGYGMLRDVDMAGCYNNIIARMNVYWGRPVIYEPGGRRLPLAQAVAFVREHADPDAWVIRVSGNINSYPNALVPSTQGAVNSFNYRQKLSTGKRRRATQRAFHLEALLDPASVKGTRESKLYSSVVESGVITWATWLMIEALPAPLRLEYERLEAETLIFYPHVLVAGSGPEYDELVDKYRNEALPWESALDLEGMELIHREKLDADFIALKLPVGDYARKVGEFRKEAQQAEGKGGGLDMAWKVHANSMYGVLASPHLPTNNIVGANIITATARAEAFAMSQALNAIQTITDGCTYRIDQVPACTYEECLSIRRDYPIRRAELGDGVPFLDPATIPQDDAGFTCWYRNRVKWFFGVSGPEFDKLFATHDLEHKKTGKSKQVAFDALGCDGSGNYLKCTRTQEGAWQVEDAAARAYGPISKEVLAPWLLHTYSEDRLTGPPPIAEDTELLSFHKAGQKARKALGAGLPAVYFPLGLENIKVMNYRVIKASAFIFRTPEQRAAVLKQLQIFEKKTGTGLEVLALRRPYGGRRRGSLAAVAEELYQLIRQGKDNLTKTLNLNKVPEKVLGVTSTRLREILLRKAEAEAKLWITINVLNLPPEYLATAYVVTPADIIHIKGDDAFVMQTSPAPAEVESNYVPWPGMGAGVDI
jgi:hypothetical protein